MFSISEDNADKFLEFLSVKILSKKQQSLNCVILEAN